MISDQSEIKDHESSTPFSGHVRCRSSEEAGGSLRQARTTDCGMKAEELRLIHIQNRMGMSLRSMAKQWHLPFLMNVDTGKDLLSVTGRKQTLSNHRASKEPYRTRQ